MGNFSFLNQLNLGMIKPVLLILFYYMILVRGQTQDLTNRPDPVVDRQFQRITERPLLLGGTEGSSLLFPNYVLGSIFAKRDTLRDVELNLDLSRNTVNFKSPQGIRYIHDFYLNKVSFMQPGGDKYYIPTAQLDESIEDPTFSLEIYKGEISFYKVYYLEEYKQNYNILMDEGSKQDRIIIKEDLYLYTTDKKLIRLPKNKKKFAAVFNDKSEMIFQFIKDNKLSVKNEDHIIDILHFYRDQFSKELSSKN